MIAGDEHLPGSPQDFWEDFLAVLGDLAIWRLLVKGLTALRPGCEVTAGSVRFAERSSMAGGPVFLSEDSGFGLRLRARAAVPAPQREIYVRGQDVRAIGIVITGSPTAIGTRIVDAASLLRYARRLTFESLSAVSDEGSVIPAVRAARAVKNVVLLDSDTGIGLCVEVDPATESAVCPLFVRFTGRSGDRTDDPSSGTVHAYASGGWAAQAVRSQI